MELRRLTPGFGAEVKDIDLSGDLDTDTIEAVYNALVDYKVLLLRAPELTPDQHMALGRRIGEIEVHAVFPNLGEGFEQVSVLDSEAGNTATMWHTDETFLEHPPMGTLTQAKILPDVGGDTLFADSAAAYNALSPNMKQYLEGLTAIHDLGKIAELRYRFGSGDAQNLADAVLAERRTAHPVVRTHPETGRKGLYINPAFTLRFVGWTKKESRPLLEYLFEVCRREVYTCRFRWKPGSIAMWDNRCVWHFALNDYHGQRRHMRRVTVNGDAVR